MDEKFTLCLIDVSGYIFRAFYALPPMTRPDGTPVNAVYGFVRMLMNLLTENPCTHIGAMCDASRHTFRTDLYPQYKQNRAAVPEALIPQFPLIQQALKVFGIPAVQKEGVEADDLIASYTQAVLSRQGTVQILSADKDLMQLMRPGVSLFDPMKKKEVSLEDVKAKFGVAPEQVVAVQALMGDSTDNIPGAKGIGPKTAAELIQTYQTISNLYAHLPDIKPDKRRDMLALSQQDVLISEKLAKLDGDVPLPIPLDSLKPLEPDLEQLEAFLTENGFKKTPRLEKWLQDRQQTLQVFAQPVLTELKSLEQVRNFLKNTHKTIALWEQGNQIFIKTDQKVGEIHYQEEKIQGDLFQSGPCGVSRQDLCRELNIIFQDSTVTKIVYDAKAWYHFLKASAPWPAILDVSLLLFLKKGTQGTLEKEGEDGLEKVSLLHQMGQDLFGSLSKEERDIYQNLDEPLIYILYQMEKAGIQVDISKLEKLRLEFEKKQAGLQEEIYQLAGRSFNIQSPAQLGVLMFEDLKYPGGKKGPSGAWVTDSDILEELALTYPLAEKVLMYRQISKLQNTYILPLIEQAKKSSEHRIYTSFSMVNTSTGRLASFHPNLQNIPVRTEDGKAIREAFVAKKGCALVGADYSQVELRLMAGIAGVKGLQEAFAHGADIHALTAAGIAGVPLEQVTPDMRRQAKAINFGIMYGMSAFGLAKSLGIPQEQAKAYKDAYFKKYPEIKAYMDKTIQQAKTTGFVQTPAGRRCFVMGFSSPKTRGNAERAAINAPVQGGAADVIKQAMIETTLALKTHKIPADLLLQVHDELIFEVPENFAQQAALVIKDAMEHNIKTQVPLIVDVKIGNNWREIH